MGLTSLSVRTSSARVSSVLLYELTCKWQVVSFLIIGKKKNLTSPRWLLMLLDAPFATVSACSHFSTRSRTVFDSASST